MSSNNSGNPSNPSTSNPSNTSNPSTSNPSDTTTNTSDKLGNSTTKDIDHSHKHITIIAFVILAVLIVCYVIYCFEAYRNGWFPFSQYVLNVPDNAVQPLGEVTPLSADDIAELADKVKQANVDNCNFYASVDIKLPKGQSPLGGCSSD